jgi:ABC-type bacteriocin/lantibiotic exporter with double-glycine peptidase domain
MSSGRRWFAPEVIQTSAMDCGPAALKCLLEGFGLPASYGRLREACQTAVDGTSIDTLEQVAGMLGLEVEQITLPRENLFLAAAAALPALVVVTLPGGLTHFVVMWRLQGGWVQVMDPARGRRWARARHLLGEVYLHDNRVAAGDFRGWAESEGFRDPLATRLRRLGVPRAPRLVDDALAVPGWHAVAALDAATRAGEALVDRGALPRSRAASAVKALYADARAVPPEEALVGQDLWAVRPAPDDADTLIVRGAIAVRVVGRRTDPEAARAPQPPELTAVVEAHEPGPAAQFIAMLRADGLWRLPPLVAGLLLAAAGAVFEALLFRGFLDVGRRLPLVEQRMVAAGALMLLVAALLCVEWPVWGGLLGIGRRIELRLRRAFAEKIPRVGDRYFQSRTVSDMAERAHLVHWLRLLPGQGGQLIRATGELVVTTAGIVWLHPPSAPIAIGLAAAMVGVPLLFQPALVERDLRMRSHAGGLARFYLDALMGLVAIRAHAAETSLVREHDERLGEWASAAWASARTAVTAEATQVLVGFLLAAWLLFHYLVTAPGSGWALLLVYWALALPVLGQEIGFLIQQYPVHRNITLRLVEPLGAPEAALAAPSETPARPPRSVRPGMEIRMEAVLVRAAGHDVLRVDDLLIEAGSHVAVVGSSGAGKSSLAGVLLGWHEPVTGRVLVDGRPLGGEVLALLRRQTVWVEPGVYLWNSSLLDNLRYGADEATRPVGAAVEEADLDDVLGRLPAGLQTPLGEAGALLSGGEGQRVRFGRGVVRGPARLVILDEAFRGLDSSQRRVLLARARARWREATFLFISHDIADTLDFDRVLVVAGGRIVEDGTPARRAEQPGSRYREMLEAERRVRARFASGDWRHLVVEGATVHERSEPR